MTMKALNWDKIARDACPKGWKVAAVQLQEHGDVSITWDTGVDDENRYGSVLVGVEDVQREGAKKVGFWLKEQAKGYGEKLAMVRKNIAEADAAAATAPEAAPAPGDA